MSVRVFVGDATRRWAHDLDDLRDRWKIRREAPTETEWMPVLQFSSALDGLDDRSLQDIKARLLEIRRPIQKEQDRLARAHRFGRGGDNLETWEKFHEIKSALASVGMHLLAVHDAQGRRGRRRKDERAREWERCFVEAAKQLLTPEQFAELETQAHVLQALARPAKKD